MPQHDALRKQLEDRLTRLLHRVGTIEGDLRQTRDPDWTERATALENDEVLEGLDEMTLREIEQIRTALKRIESGSYGTCSACGRPIGTERRGRCSQRHHLPGLHTIGQVRETPRAAN